jgi:hypothetical protein
MEKTYDISVRLPVNLAYILKYRAQTEHRSINGMIVYLLNLALETEAQALAQPTTQSPDSMSADWPAPVAQSLRVKRPAS